MSTSVYEFGDFRLDSGRFELSRNGKALRVERKPLELLILLASREGQLVTRGEIAERLWSSEVFVDTEHGINTAIRKLRHLLRDDPDDPKFIQTVTGMGYRFVAAVAMGGGAVAAEPADNSEAPGERRAELREEADPIREPMQGRRDVWRFIGVAGALVMVLLGIAVGYHPAVAWLLHRKTGPVIKSLAVLPLDNFSGDPNQEYFADGVTDELITMLVKDSKLRITSRTSVMQYKGAHKPLPEIARALHVDAIVEGSISRTDKQVHMTLQLIRADTDSHLWADSYDRATDDSATLPEDAARAIAKRLNASAPSPTNTRYVNPAAHDAYLRGLFIWYSGSNEEAGEYFRKAVEIQPDYALGLTGLASYYEAGAFEGELDPRIALPKGQEAATKAVALDDSLPEAHLAMAAAIYAGRWDWKWSEQEIRRAVELNPNFADGWHFYAKMLGPLNRENEAIAAQRKSTDLDPFERPWALAAVLNVARQFDACLADAALREETYPHNATLHFMKAACYRGKGMAKESIDEMSAFYRDTKDPEAAVAIERAFARGGMAAVTRWQLEVSRESAGKHYSSPMVLAQLYADLGEREKALAELEEAYKQHSPQLLWVQTEPAFDFLHSDPQYRSIIQRTGLPPAY